MKNVTFRTDLFRKAMKDNEYTQGLVARKLSVNRSTVKRWYDGTSCPSYMQGKKIAELFNMEMRELYNGLDDEFEGVITPAIDYLEVMLGIQNNVEKWSRTQRVCLVELLMK